MTDDVNTSKVMPIFFAIYAVHQQAVEGIPERFADPFAFVVFVANVLELQTMFDDLDGVTGRIVVVDGGHGCVVKQAALRCRCRLAACRQGRAELTEDGELLKRAGRMSEGLGVDLDWQRVLLVLVVIGPRCAQYAGNVGHALDGYAFLVEEAFELVGLQFPQPTLDLFRQLPVEMDPVSAVNEDWVRQIVLVA